MARLANSKVISVDENGVLHFLEDGDYTIDFKRFVQIFLEDGQTTNIDPDEFAGLSIAAEDANKITYADAPDRIDLSGIAFIGADESGTGGAETSVNIDEFLARLLQDQDAGSLAQVLTIDGSQATAFEVLWEYLDDGYVDEGYFASVNENFVRLGIAYLDYLEDGGAPLTDSVGKFAPDGPDADLVPERLQSLHDNLLGNLIGSVIDGRFDPALAAELTRRGHRVALVSDAGTPGISDPGARLVAAAREAGFQAVTIPGPSALTAALSIAGVDATEFIFLGFLPHKKGRQTALKALADEKRAIVLYESPHRIEKLMGELGEVVPEREVTLARELTKMHEEVLKGTPSELWARLETTPARGEFVVIVHPE